MSVQSKVEKVLANYNSAKRDKLIPILQDIQEAEGFISKAAVLQVAKHLNIPASKVYGVATFYNQFRFEALGTNHVMVCRGTACHVKGSLSVLQMAEEVLGIKAGQTTRDGLFSIETVACMGACGLAPVVSVNGEFHAKITSDKLRKIIDEIRNREKSNAAK